MCHVAAVFPNIQQSVQDRYCTCQHPNNQKLHLMSTLTNLPAPQRATVGTASSITFASTYSTSFALSIIHCLLFSTRNGTIQRAPVRTMGSSSSTYRYASTWYQGTTSVTQFFSHGLRRVMPMLIDIQNAWARLAVSCGIGWWRTVIVCGSRALLPSTSCWILRRNISPLPHSCTYCTRNSGSSGTGPQNATPQVSDLLWSPSTVQQQRILDKIAKSTVLYTYIVESNHRNLCILTYWASIDRQSEDSLFESHQTNSNKWECDR